MHKVRARKLRPWEGQKLKRMKRQLSNAVNSRHARMILLSGGGLTNGQIAERVIVRPLGFAGSFTGLIEGESTRSPGILGLVRHHFLETGIFLLPLPQRLGFAPNFGPEETRGFPILVYSFRLEGDRSDRLKSDPAGCIFPPVPFLSPSHVG